MNDFLSFRRMVTPVIIQILFWIAVLICVLTGGAFIVGGLNAHYGGGAQAGLGLLWLLGGPLLARVYCEVLLVIFKILEVLVEIRRDLRR